jgi:hypothetical protein
MKTDNGQYLGRDSNAGLSEHYAAVRREEQSRVTTRQRRQAGTVNAAGEQVGQAPGVTLGLSSSEIEEGPMGGVCCTRGKDEE